MFSQHIGKVRTPIPPTLRVARSDFPNPNPNPSRTHTDHIGATEVYFKSEKVGDLHSNRGLRLPITVLEASLRKGTKKNSGEPYYNTANKA